MTESSEGQRAAGADTGGPAPSSSGHGSDPGVSSSPVGPSTALVGPFTLRETVFGGGVALVFIGTLLPFIDGMVRSATFWNTEPLFFIGIGILMPVIALALLAGRRLGSHGLRVGSLSVDQFASVSAVLAAAFFFLETVTDFRAGSLLALIGALGMLAATVVGPFLPVVRNDFEDRPEVAAHRTARPMTAAGPRPPRPEKVEKAEKAEKPGKVLKAEKSLASVTTGPATGDAGSSAAPGRSGATDRGRAGDDINPAAAAVRQNGAGLYGAGGAGVVGAGAAASGQSGLERSAAQASDRDASAESGAHSVGEDADERTDGRSDRSPESRTGAADQIRAHDVVRDESTKTYGAADAAPEERARQEPITATRSADEEPVVEAFWFAVGSPRPVVDEQSGREIFTLQPGDWEVGIEDRGHEFLVQDKRTGAVGILRDLRNIERAPRD
ncbi:hypothetical protein [Arthrobacter sp. N1]|uniref:hypothetical protein n=1 Tax=Arthrobacter sp. N1 TaxID=619291 RepID=UPI003BAF67A3